MRVIWIPEDMGALASVFPSLLSAFVREGPQEQVEVGIVGDGDEHRVSPSIPIPRDGRSYVVLIPSVPNGTYLDANHRPRHPSESWDPA
jgi:hypothetical protein